MDMVSLGRIVHVIIAGKHLPAIVTYVPVHMQPENAKDSITVCVFPDGNVMRTPTIVSSVVNDESKKKFGTWHWPERVE